MYHVNSFDVIISVNLPKEDSWQIYKLFIHFDVFVLKIKLKHNIKSLLIINSQLKKS